MNQGLVKKHPTTAKAVLSFGQMQKQIPLLMRT